MDTVIAYLLSILRGRSKVAIVLGGHAELENIFAPAPELALVRAVTPDTLRKTHAT